MKYGSFLPDMPVPTTGATASIPPLAPDQFRRDDNIFLDVSGRVAENRATKRVRDFEMEEAREQEILRERMHLRNEETVCNEARVISQAERTLNEVAEAGYHTREELSRLTHHLGKMEEALKDHLKPASPMPETPREEVKEDHPESSHVRELRKLRDLHRANFNRIIDITQTVIGFTDRLVIP